MKLFPRTNAHADPRAAAHRILDAWQGGQAFAPKLIRWALRMTGDL